MSTHTHDPQQAPPISYASALKDGDAYENHDFQTADVPGIKSFNPAQPPASYAGVLKDGGDAYPRAGQINGSHTSTLHKRETSTGKPTPPKPEEVSLDMASDAYITLARRVGQNAIASDFPYPSIARARWAPDPKAGKHADTEARKEWERALADKVERRDWERRTVLEKHCAFFDRDNDGVIWPLDTFLGFYALGFGLVLSVIATFIIHFSFSWISKGGLLPDPFFRFYIQNAYKCKHGSDSATYDTEGRFIPQKASAFALRCYVADCCAV